MSLYPFAACQADTSIHLSQIETDSVDFSWLCHYFLSLDNEYLIFMCED